MNHNNTLVLGTRGSDLALAQADLVTKTLRKRFPDLVIERKIIATTGDLHTDIALADIARSSNSLDKGVFIKELELALLHGEIDIAVHSLKDVPSVLAKDFTIASVLPRAAACDVLISKTPDWQGYGMLATGSVRRGLMAQQYWHGTLQIVPVRGNVPTRLAKFAQHADWQGMILAKAGLDRLGLFAPACEFEDIPLFMTCLPTDVFVPAVGQGIIGIECRTNDHKTQAIVHAINDIATMTCAMAERSFLQHLHADCSTPIGVYADYTEKEQLRLCISYFPPNSSVPINIKEYGNSQEPSELGYQAFKHLHELLA